MMAPVESLMTKKVSPSGTLPAAIWEIIFNRMVDGSAQLNSFMDQQTNFITALCSKAKEMKIASIVALWHPLLILAFAAIACFVFVHHPVKYGYWLNNPGYHGFSEMLYEYTSASANNGSGFEGLGDTPSKFWNVTTGFVLIFGRYLPIIGQIAIAGSLAGKKFIPESAGTLKTDTVTFGVMVFAVIVIIAALSFFPALSLGPIAEYFSMR